MIGKYIVYAHGKDAPRAYHDSYDPAAAEARRIAAKEPGRVVAVARVVTAYKAEVTVNLIGFEEDTSHG